MTRERRQYDFQTKLEIVRRHVAGESGRALAEEYDLPSPTTVANWMVIYRREGEGGLRLKRRGRPLADPDNRPPESELEALRRENEHLRAADLPRSTLYDHRRRLQQPDRHAALKAAIRRVFQDARSAYGHRRVLAVLLRQGWRVSKKTVLKLMRELGLVRSPASPIPLRRRNALRFLPVALALVPLYAYAGYQWTVVPGYWDGVASSATIFLVFAAPYAAVAAAADAGRLRRAGTSWRTASRGPMSLLWDTIKYPVLFGVMVQGFGFLLVSIPSIGNTGFPTPWLGVVWLTIIALHASVGYVIGWLLPVAVALPAGLLLSLVPLTFAWASTIIPLRYLAGLALSECCTVDAAPAPAAIITAIIFNSLALIGVWIMVAAPTLRGGALMIAGTAGFLMIVAAFVVSFQLAGSLGLFPAITRPLDALVCEGSAPEVCLYPEQRSAGDPDTTLRAASPALANFGLSAPEVIIGNREAGDANTVGAMVSPSLSNRELLLSFVAGYVAADVSTACYEGPNATAQSQLSDLVRQTLLRIIDPMAPPSPEIAEQVAEILTLPRSEALRMITELLQGVRSCQVPSGWELEP